MDYIAYSDESYVTAHRYRSIASFSFPARHHDKIASQIADNLSSSDITEFKWKKLDSAKYRLCAQKLVDSVIDIVHKLDARIDTIIWDTYDNRHAIQNRDDNANFERMFFHLHGKALKRRIKTAKWRLHPDERMGVDWQIDFKEVNSKNTPCCQVADLFAGIAVFSRIDHEKFWKWHAKQEPSLGLFADEKPNLSRSDVERFPVLDHLNRRCKQYSLGVSLKRQGGLYTYDPKNPINFWLYQPQHDADQAPVKKLNQSFDTR